MCLIMNGPELVRNYGSVVPVQVRARKLTLSMFYSERYFILTACAFCTIIIIINFLQLNSVKYTYHNSIGMMIKNNSNLKAEKWSAHNKQLM